jgi:deoxyribodipyrimidine photo-lyase
MEATPSNHWFHAARLPSSTKALPDLFPFPPESGTGTDAGMRQLWETGTMQNRVRMVAASFLVKHLLVPWTEGAAWFRIFNPSAQGKRFDPQGSYIRRWVPELEQLPDALIHEPWKAAPGELDRYGLAPDSPYRKPVVDHAFARERALEAYRIMNLH